MRFELESSDIEAIASMVVGKLTNKFDELRQIAAKEHLGNKTLPLEDVKNLKPKSKVVSTNELLKLTGLSRSTIWRLEKEKSFPSRRSLSGKRVGWIRTEVDEWLATRKRL
ncbi:transcriptional regulator, AlpA family [Trichlorobacter thiogenes]|uniref:Transcriptional regulator, AlpA family n=1 Tax=Trichlorobacter thiogenes TaxID=115783 RepID=A0A1T4RBH5_9BACT|nr:AlpA family transcriptional regulator [Trichlorobacter thiogenes]SKA13313.1 transcriptional regulator, AlpA family [Trichlorobacter thiogenes]